jgi:hypothetical protein
VPRSCLHGHYCWFSVESCGFQALSNVWRYRACSMPEDPAVNTMIVGPCTTTGTQWEPPDIAAQAAWLFTRHLWSSRCSHCGRKLRHRWSTVLTPVHHTCRLGTVEGGLFADQRGLMAVQALDASCGTAELPVQSPPPLPALSPAVPPPSGPRRPPTPQELFWAPLPLRHMLRSCAGGSPLTGSPWWRLDVHVPTTERPLQAVSGGPAWGQHRNEAKPLVPTAAGGASAEAGGHPVEGQPASMRHVIKIKQNSGCGTAAVVGLQCSSPTGAT